MTDSEALIAFLVFLVVMAIGGAIVLAIGRRKNPLEQRLDELEDSKEQEEEQADKSLLVRSLSFIGRLVSGNPSRDLQETLAREGYHDRSASAIYLAIKVLLCLGGIAGIVIVLFPLELNLGIKVLASLGGGAILSFLPNYFLRLRRLKRAEEVRCHLPDAIDLLEVCVSAGMGLEMAWNSVADEVRRVSSTLADEMALTNLEIQLGATRADAMRHMADRTASSELSSLVATLVQCERFGTSIATALRTFAGSIRVARSQRAEESAEKMAIKLLFPMIMFIFPAMLIVLAGPAMMDLSKYIF